MSVARRLLGVACTLTAACAGDEQPTEGGAPLVLSGLAPAHAVGVMPMPGPRCQPVPAGPLPPRP